MRGFGMLVCVPLDSGTGRNATGPQCHRAAMPQILYATSELRLWVSVFLDLYLNNIALSLLKP